MFRKNNIFTSRYGRVYKILRTHYMDDPYGNVWLE